MSKDILKRKSSNLSKKIWANYTGFSVLTSDGLAVKVGKQRLKFSQLLPGSTKSSTHVLKPKTPLAGT